MRFVADGPDIPNSLITEWREGKVVFIAGAGVSVPKPSDLPLFKGLVLKVYKKLNDQLFNALSQASETDDPQQRNQVLESILLDARRKVEADLFFKGEYDRLFAALEARLDQDSKGRVSDRKVRNAVEDILQNHGGHGVGHRDLIRISTTGRITSNPASGGLTCRIATTNFDLLLEEAAITELSTSPGSFDARMAPRPGSYDFEGIIHLHGKIDPDAAHRGDLILSSRDFAKTYLRSGVVANYIYDLVRRYRVVLIGYSADDQTMRYLMDAIGEDASLFDDMRTPYVIAKRDRETATDIFVQTWRARNIEPLPYDLRGSKDHGALWDTLHQWAKWAKHDIEWVKEQCAAAMALPPRDADSFSRNFVEDIFRILPENERSRVIKFLNERGVDFDWIDAIRPGPGSPLSTEAAS